MYQPPQYAAEIDWSDEFQERRREAWRKSRFAFALLAVGVAVFWIPSVEIYGFVAFATAIVWLTFVCRRYYTCPSCNEVPMSTNASIGVSGFSYSRYVDFNPEFCSTCGVRLRPKVQAKHG